MKVHLSYLLLLILFGTLSPGCGKDSTTEAIPAAMFKRFVTDQFPEMGEVIELAVGDKEKSEMAKWASALFFQYHERSEHFGENASELWLRDIALEELCRRLAVASTGEKSGPEAKEKLIRAVTRLEKTKAELNLHRIVELKEELAVREAMVNETEEQTNVKIREKVADLIEEASAR